MTDALPRRRGVVSWGSLSVLRSVRPNKLGKKRDISALKRRGGAMNDLPWWYLRLPQSRKYGRARLAVLFETVVNSRVQRPKSGLSKGLTIPAAVPGAC